MKKIVKSVFRTVGLEVRRTASSGLGAKRKKEANKVLCPIFDDPLEALHFMRGGINAAFHCPLNRMIMLNGLTFGHSGWNPFSETSRQIRSGDIEIQNSVLHRYYASWQPVDASNAIIGLRQSCQSLKGASPHLYYFVPWRSYSLTKVEKQVLSWFHADMRTHGFSAISIEKDGFKNHGPASAELVVAEITRLRNILSTLIETGYDRNYGEVRVWLLRRGDEVRFVNRGGLHRAAAMDALGSQTIPANFVEPAIVDINDVDYWPQVRLGTWTRSEALSYFHHLFDFDVKSWAKENNCCPMENGMAVPS